MNNFIEFLNNTNHLPYVLSSYFITLFLVLILRFLSKSRTSKLEREFRRIGKSDESKI